LPFGSSVAVARARDVDIEPVGDHVPDAGSYSSALATKPPAMSTLPFGSRVAVWRKRESIIVPAEDHVFVAGS
jgi:hypothetical protein